MISGVASIVKAEKPSIEKTKNDHEKKTRQKTVRTTIARRI